MLSSAKSSKPWNLADPKSQRSSFTSESFYVVIEGVVSKAVRLAATTIKEALLKWQDVRVKGPLALPTVRRRHVILREVRSLKRGDGYYANAKRVRNVLLVLHPSAEAVAALTSLVLPTTVNVKIESYASQYELKDHQ